GANDVLQLVGCLFGVKPAFGGVQSRIGVAQADSFPCRTGVRHLRRLAERGRLGWLLGADLCSHLHLVGGQGSAAVTRVRLQVRLEQLTEDQASAIERNARKVSEKEVGQVVFVVEPFGGETAAREGAISLLACLSRLSLLGPRSSSEE